MAVGTIPLSEARSLLQHLTGAQRTKLADAIAEAEQRHIPTVDVGWLKPGGVPSKFETDTFQSNPKDEEAISAAVETWLAPPIEGKSNAACDRDIAAGESLLQDKNLSVLEQARVHLRLSGLIMQKADSPQTSMLDKRAFATQGFQTLKRAHDLAPNDAQIAEAYARTMDNFARLGGVKQFFLQQGLGINIEKSAAAALGPLKNFPDNASIQFARLRLAEALGNTSEAGLARELLAKLPQSAVELARASYDNTTARVSDAAKE